MIRVSIAKIIALATLMVFLLTALTPFVALAGWKGRRNTAIGLGALSIYSLARGHTGTGLLLGAGAAYSYKRSQDVKHHKHMRYYYSKKDHRYHKVYR
jgi:hypothetical protein